MISVSKHVTRRIMLTLSSVLLVMLLAACSFPGLGGSSTPTASTPTTAPVTPTPGVSFQTYTDSNFSINYPNDWKAPQQSNGSVVFSDSLGIYNLTVGTAANPGGVLTSDQLADAGIATAQTSLKNTQTVSVPATASVGGQTWSQRAISGTGTENGQDVEVQLVVLAISYPVNSQNAKGYVIVYGTLKQTFDIASATYFTPMLQSFKFPS